MPKENGTLNWYRANRPERLHEMPMIDDFEYDVSVLRPGCVLIYINPETGKGNHLALYVGEINGEPIVARTIRLLKEAGVSKGNITIDYNKDRPYEKAVADGWVPGETLFEIEEACEKATVIEFLLSDADLYSMTCRDRVPAHMR